MRHLRRKITVRAHGQQVVLVKKKGERMAHVWMKAFLWARYLPAYPDLAVEVGVGAKYKPDVVQVDPRLGAPVFWGEAGHVGADKLGHLLARYPRTHCAFAKWDAPLAPFAEQIEAALAAASAPRRAPVDLYRVPPDAPRRFVDAKGRITLPPDAFPHRRF
jgi:hypothetical protein